MSSTARQNNLLLAEDWQKIYQSFKNADFQSYDFDNLRRTMIDYLRTNFPEDFNDYIESSEYLALIDLIAFVGQNIAFRVDLNARENFLETAERRDSILRLAKLISYNPSRNTPANGLLKFTTISTTEDVLDSNGRNLSGQIVSWNDPSNNNWYDQFIKVLNAALPTAQQFGNPVDQATIYGIPTAQYRFNATNTNVPIYSFTKTVAGATMNFEISSTTFKGKEFLYEEAPKIGNAIACVYTDDGYGAGSPGTGFFFRFTQGTLNQGTFTVTQPSSNETIDINTANINNDDVWLYSIDQKGMESSLWSKIPALAGNNVIYNSLNLNVKDIYNVITRANDQVTLAFSDGVFGSLPLGTFRVYYRVSNNLTYTINPSDILNVAIAIPYMSASGQPETLTIGLNLVTSVTNATSSETNDTIKTNAPQTYYLQNRMITAEDYNIGPLTASHQVAKIKALNRTSSGISRYFDLTDPTGKYSSTNLFADDGILYQQPFVSTTTFTHSSTTDIQGVIYDEVFKILATPEIRNFYYANYVNYLTSNLSIAWYNITTDAGSSSGYIGGIANSTPSIVGTTVYSDLRYVVPGTLLKFTAPEGYYFDTTAKNKLVAGDGTKIGAVSYLWAEVVSITGNGTGANNTGVLTSGDGPIILNQIIPGSSATDSTVRPILTQLIPTFATTITSTVITTMIDLISSNNPFGLRYDALTQSWQIIFETNLDKSSAFSLQHTGDASNGNLDPSWFLLFTTNNDIYTITSRGLRYVFESDAQVSFYFDSNLKIYDTISSSIVPDVLKVLSINTHKFTTNAYTVDKSWRVTSEYVGLDGYIDPKKIVLSFEDSDNNGVVDNPQLFLDIVEPADTGDNMRFKYIVQEKYTITEGQDDYRYTPNDPDNGPVIIKSTESDVYPFSQWQDGQYFYFMDTRVVKKLDISIGDLVPTLDYKVYVGRDGLKFQYIHSADYDSRIDPGVSNIHDVYVLTTSYDTAFRQWISGAPVAEPLPPSNDALRNMLAPNLDLIKAISDEIVYHPVSYKLLFGPGADPSLQATFNVIINPSSVVSNADVIARILAAINEFFALSNWDFGDTFYFSELATFVMTQLAPDVTNFVIVPKQAGQYFGSLFEIQCPSNQIFISSATAENIVVVSGFTNANLKTVTGQGLAAIGNSQQVTSANYGASN